MNIKQILPSIILLLSIYVSGMEENGNVNNPATVIISAKKYPFKKDIKDVSAAVYNYFFVPGLYENIFRADPDIVSETRKSQMCALNEKLSKINYSRTIQVFKELNQNYPHAHIVKRITVEDVWKKIPDDLKALANQPKALNKQEKLACNEIFIRAMYINSVDYDSDRYPDHKDDESFQDFLQKERNRREKLLNNAINAWHVVSGQKYPWISKYNLTTQIYLWWEGYPPVGR